MTTRSNSRRRRRRKSKKSFILKYRAARRKTSRRNKALMSRINKKLKSKRRSKRRSRKISRKKTSRKKTSKKTGIRMPVVIKYVGWGDVVVDIRLKTKRFKDVIIEPTRAYKWDFKKNFNKKIDDLYTSHQYKKDKTKGIQPYSVRNLLDKGSIFILTTGFHGDLGVNKKTIKFLKDEGKKVIVVNTKDVMHVFNDLAKRKKDVVALVHSTC